MGRRRGSPAVPIGLVIVIALAAWLRSACGGSDDGGIRADAGTDAARRITPTVALSAWLPDLRTDVGSLAERRARVEEEMLRNGTAFAELSAAARPKLAVLNEPDKHVGQAVCLSGSMHDRQKRQTPAGPVEDARIDTVRIVIIGSTEWVSRTTVFCGILVGVDGMPVIVGRFDRDT